MLFIHQYPGWTNFRYDLLKTLSALAEVRAFQGKLSGKLLFAFGEEKSKNVRLRDWQALLAIDGVHGDIRSALLRTFENYNSPLDIKALCRLHASLGYNGYLRENSFSGISFLTKSGEQAFFSGVSAERVETELSLLLEFFNNAELDPVLVAGIIHFWFLTIRPFQSGNGCMARILCDLALSRSENSAFRFYSVFEQILKNKEEYFLILERTWVGNGNITKWLLWFFSQIQSALIFAEKEWEIPLAETLQRLRLGNVSLLPREMSLLEFLRKNGGEISSSKWANQENISHDSALRDFKSMIEKGILEKNPKTKGRNTKYRVKNIL